MQQYKEEIATLLSQKLELTKEMIIVLLVTPPNPKLGDIALPCFQLAKTMPKNPKQIASELETKITLPASLSKVKAEGAYLNFTINHNRLISNVLHDIREKGSQFGRDDSGEGKTIIIDYSSPNIAKPLAIHHIRSTIIGAALCRLYRFFNYQVEAINHLGDWGTNFGQLMVAYKKEEANLGHSDVDISSLLRLYISFHQEVENDAALQEEAKKWFVKLEEGDAEAVRLWQLFCRESLNSFKILYKRLGVEFDHFIGESFFNDKMADTLSLIAEKNLSEISEGALVVKLEAEKLPPCLLRKKDGSTLYATRDLAAAQYRYQTYDFTKCLYVVANQQELHFRQVFQVLKKLGYDWADRLLHIKFGMLSFGSNVFAEQNKERITGSTRKGHIVFLEDVLDRAKEKAEKLLRENLRDEEGIDLSRLAEDIGVGAIIFNELGQRRQKDIIFTWERALNLQGDSGPYLQYTHARLCSVIRKAKLNITEKIDFSPLGTELEFELIKTLALFPAALKKALAENEISIISDYLLGLAASFNRFFTDKHKHRIIGDDKKLSLARVGLVDCTRKVLAQGLTLLGIKCPEKM